jgi:hypothetical protein
VARALWFLALLAAFVVVGARCLSAFTSALPSAEDNAGHAALGDASHAPSGEDATTSDSLDDGSDDGADALLAPVSARIEILPPAVGPNELSGFCQLHPPQSHTPSLERPPRA